MTSPEIQDLFNRTLLAARELAGQWMQQGTVCIGPASDQLPTNPELESSTFYQLFRTLYTTVTKSAPNEKSLRHDACEIFRHSCHSNQDIMGIKNTNPSIPSAQYFDAKSAEMQINGNLGNRSYGYQPESGYIQYTGEILPQNTYYSWDRNLQPEQLTWIENCNNPSAYGEVKRYSSEIEALILAAEGLAQEWIQSKKINIPPKEKAKLIIGTPYLQQMFALMCKMN